MNEVKTVHLGRQQFTIAVDAQKALQEYLQAIEKQPGVQAEVVKEVETRMAELLLERGITPDKVVLPEDVDFLKEQLGEPRDFTDDEAENADSKTRKDKNGDTDTPRRLYRDTQNGMIAGVASGLAAYMGVDVILVRIAFVVLTFASGVGILLYILIWLLAPDAKTPSERLQMRGKAVTVDSLKEVVDRADIKGAGKRVSETAGKGVARAAESIAKIILAVLGAGFVLAGAVAMVVSIAAGAYMLIHGARLGTETIFPQNSTEIWLVVMAGTGAVIFGFALLMIGLAMITRKWRLPAWLVAAMAGIFLAATAIGVALGADAYPKLQDRYEAAKHSVIREYPAFTSINLTGKVTEYEFIPSDRSFIEITYLGDLNPQDVKSELQGQELKINTNDFVKKQCTGFCLHEDREVKIVIHTPVLERVTLNGRDNYFNIEEALKQNAITLVSDDINDNHFNILQVEPETAVLNQKGRSLSLTLTNPKQSASPDSNLRMDEYITLLPGVDTFRLITPETCRDDEPLVYFFEAPREITVNDTTVTGRDNLRKLHDRKEKTSLNCVAVQ